MPNPNIQITGEKRIHSKASEVYIPVRFTYPGVCVWEGWVPIEYRRTGLHLETPEEIEEHLNYAYICMNPCNYITWRRNQECVWGDGKKGVTQPFFDTLAENNDFAWKCVGCELPQNPNWARRIQDLKEMGYTLATDTNRYCPTCGGNRTHIMLLPLPRGGRGNGYETWSPELRARIIRVLGGIDAFEAVQCRHCLPDHKFPEIRWGQDTLGENPNDMTNEQIKAKFQLLTNQRNQQKREVCRTCYQTGIRGNYNGINFFYSGTEKWDETIPREGRAAEAGCIGCPWYDLEEWRRRLNAGLN